MHKKLSADPNALIFGIISLIVVFLGCCCGPFVVASIILSVVGLVLANKSLREYKLAPEDYDSTSKNNVYVAKVINIIALVLSLLFLIVFILKIAFFGNVLTSGLMKDILNNREQWEQIDDSISKINFDSIVEENSRYIDTLKVESEKE